MKLFEQVTKEHLANCFNKGIKELSPVYCWFPKRMADGKWIWLEWAYREILPIKYYVFQDQLQNPKFLARYPDDFEIRYHRARREGE